MKKLLLLVFGLSLFMVGCTDDSGSGTDTGGGTGGSTPISVKDFDIKINDATDPANILNKITGIADNTPMSMKGGVVTIGTAGTEILTKDANTVEIAEGLASLIFDNGVDDSAGKETGVVTGNAKISVPTDEKSTTFDLILVPMHGYAEKVFITTLTTTAYKFKKPTEVKTSDINFKMTQPSIPNMMEFTGGSDGKGSTVITKGKLVASSTPVTATLGKDAPLTYGEFLTLSRKSAVYNNNKQVFITIHGIEGVTIGDYKDSIAGTHTMHGIMVFSNFEDLGASTVENIIFDTGYIFHIVNFNSKLVKSTTDVAPPTPGDVTLNLTALDIGAAEVSDVDSEGVIVITATPNIIVDGVLSGSVSAIAFATGTSTIVPLTKEVLEAGLKISFLTSIETNDKTLAKAISLDPIDEGVVVKVKSTELTNPTVSLTINLKTGYKFADSTKTKTITGIKTTGTIVATPGGY